MCLSIRSKYAVSNVVDYIKGKKCDCDREVLWREGAEVRG